MCAFCWLPSSADAQAALIDSKYDVEIVRAAKLWLPMWDHRWWKAQLFQESRLRPDAVSPVGAQGLCQAMPGTWKDISRALRWGTVSPFVARYCIEGGAYYMAQQRRMWKSERPESDRRQLAQASYNAGAGNILKAQKACNGARNWPVIVTCLPRITGAKNTHETTTYVERIERWYKVLVASG